MRRNDFVLCGSCIFLCSVLLGLVLLLGVHFDALLNICGYGIAEQHRSLPRATTWLVAHFFVPYDCRLGDIMMAVWLLLPIGAVALLSATKRSIWRALGFVYLYMAVATLIVVLAVAFWMALDWPSAGLPRIPSLGSDETTSFHVPPAGACVRFVKGGLLAALAGLVLVRAWLTAMRKRRSGCYRPN